MQPGRGSGYGSGPAREDRLVSFAVRGFVLAVDVRWKRHVAEPFNLRGYSARVAGGESHGAQSELAARDDLSLEFTFAKHDALTRFHLPSGAHQRPPYIGANLPCKENLHVATQMLGTRGVRGRVREHSPAAAEKSRRRHARGAQPAAFLAPQQPCHLAPPT